MRLIRRCVAVALLAAVGAGAPAHAAGGWGAPQAVGGAGSNNGAVAVDAFGNVVAVWTERGAVSMASRPPGGAFGAPEVVSGPQRGAAEPSLAITPRGEVAVAWTDSAWQVHARWGPVGGRLGPPQQIGAGTLPQLTADAFGALLVTWKSPPGMAASDVLVAERPLGARFGAARALGTTRGKPELAANLAGHAAVVWQPGDGGSVRVAARTPDGTWSAAETVPFDEPSLSGGRIGIDATGTAYLPASSFVSGPPYRSALLRRAPDGSWSAQETFEAEGTIRSFAVQPSGEATFVFGPPAGGTREADLVARIRDTAGSLSPSQLLHERANVRTLATGPRGALLAALTTPGAVKVVERGEGTPFDAPTTIGTGGVYDATPAASASGAAAVGWYEGPFEQAAWTIAVRDAPTGLGEAAVAHAATLGPAIEPVLAVGAVPATVTRALRLPVTCSEACEVTATLGSGRRRTEATRTLTPGRPATLRVRVPRGLGRRVGYRISARGYSRRTATRRGTARIRR